MWHLDIPKIAHFYWGRDMLPYLRYVSVTSFMQFNPDWKVVLWTTKRDISAGAWGASGHHYPVHCEDFNSELFKLPVEIRDVDFEQYNFPNTISEVHKSNLVNYIALSTDGGAWVDMDIIFFKPIDNLLVNIPQNKSIETYVCIGSYGHSGGFYLAMANNKYFAKLLSLCKQEYNPGHYQCIAPDLCNKNFPTVESITKITTAINFGMEAVYAHNAYHIADMVDGSPPMFLEGSIGMHWYGGHKQWGKFFQETNGGLINLSNNIICNLLRGLNTPAIPAKNSKISIIMAYYNRQDLLNKTMESIRKSSITNYELIIVDDASDTLVVCPEARILRIEKDKKWWTNPCVPYNMGFKMATGDVIIIQNPECYHIGDILNYVKENIKSNTYLSFGCYAINNNETINFQDGHNPTIGDYVFTVKTRNGWYNHSIHRPMAYHFCSAIMRKDLDRVGGFDERYAKGVAFDDDDFIRTIKGIGMEVQVINNPYVIHQFHTHGEFDSPAVFRPLHAINQTLYNNKYAPPRQAAPTSTRGGRTQRSARPRFPTGGRAPIMEEWKRLRRLRKNNR